MFHYLCTIESFLTPQYQFWQPESRFSIFFIDFKRHLFEFRVVLMILIVEVTAIFIAWIRAKIIFNVIQSIFGNLNCPNKSKLCSKLKSFLWLCWCLMFLLHIWFHTSKNVQFINVPEYFIGNMAEESMSLLQIQAINRLRVFISFDVFDIFLPARVIVLHFDAVRLFYWCQGKFNINIKRTIQTHTKNFSHVKDAFGIYVSS